VAFGLGELKKIFGFPFNIYTMAEASVFKFGTQLGFAQSHYIITPIEKSGYDLGLGELPKVLGFSYNISAAAESSKIKIGIAKAHNKIPHRRKSGRGPGLQELPKIWGSPLIFVQRLKLATSNLACSWDLPRPTIKPHPEEKWAWPRAREAPKYLGFPFNISATAVLSS